VSGHYHPKASVRARGRSISRPAFLYDDTRLILPAYGTYTGGLRSDAQVLCTLMQPEARAILTGKAPVAIPMPR
jgi:metallophosphoesterase superfamily enzyme